MSGPTSNCAANAATAPSIASTVVVTPLGRAGRAGGVHQRQQVVAAHVRCGSVVDCSREPRLVADPAVGDGGLALLAEDQAQAVVVGGHEAGQVVLDHEDRRLGVATRIQAISAADSRKFSGTTTGPALAVPKNSSQNSVRVAGEVGDPVAGLEAGADEPGGDRARAVVELPVGDRPSVTDDRRGVGLRGGGRAQQVGEARQLRRRQQ